MCKQPLSTYLYANECSSNYGCSRWYYGKCEKMRKNAKKYNFLAFFFKNIWWFDIFSVILRRFHNI